MFFKWLTSISKKKIVTKHKYKLEALKSYKINVLLCSCMLLIRFFLMWAITFLLTKSHKFYTFKATSLSLIIKKLKQFLVLHQYSLSKFQIN